MAVVAVVFFSPFSNLCSIVWAVLVLNTNVCPLEGVEKTTRLLKYTIG